MPHQPKDLPIGLHRLHLEPHPRRLRPAHRGHLTGATGTFRQRAEPTNPQRDILAKPDIQPPKKIVEATPAADA
ncbi:hypothetical protein AB0F17_02025 [Nonomuraea sp. NPDC026600]|uniref:hypothetical protein n=1 Tax=Nonomuraea sp. NPDC026600 TaxID=3155363 RepID=UPI0033E6BF96